MTVIAWDGKVLASDSCISTGAYYEGSAKKLFRLKSGGMLGISGDADSRAVINTLDSIKDGADLPTRAELEALKTDGQYLLVLPDKTTWIITMGFEDDTKAWKSEVFEAKTKFVSCGHGMDFAKAAMSLGKTSVEAVKEACKWSLACRPPIQTMKLEDRPKEKIKRVRKPQPIPEAE